MTTWSIIPVKSLEHSKSRLSDFLSGAERADLTRLMLHRLLGVLAHVPEIDGVVVVSRDESVRQIAMQFGADVIGEDDGEGLNEAAARGRNWAAAHGAKAVLILPSDLPFVQPEDVTTLMGKTAVFPINLVLCSDRHGQGTNALLLPAHGQFQFHYGPESYQHHCQEAEKMDLAHFTVSIPGLQFDLDTSQDWLLYQNEGERYW